jgi:hypothetical protein
MCAFSRKDKKGTVWCLRNQIERSARAIERSAGATILSDGARYGGDIDYLILGVTIIN